MGVNVYNRQLVIDYTTDEVFFRIHLDIPVGKERGEEIRELLERDDMPRVKEILLATADRRTHALIDALD